MPVTPELAAADARTMELLAARDFRGASLSVATYEAEQPEPRGMGIDWKHYNPERDCAVLRAIFSDIPAILRGVTQSAIETLRVAAAMMFLWGRKPRRTWLPLHYETGIDLDGDDAARMIMFYGQNQHSLAQYAEERVVDAVRVSACPGHCWACGKMNGKSFALSEAPELPHPNCTGERGCRCVYVPHLNL